MKSVFKKSVITGAMVIGLMVSPMSAGTALAADGGTGVTVMGVTPYVDPINPGDGSGILAGPYGNSVVCSYMADIRAGTPGNAVTRWCYQTADGNYWFVYVKLY